MPLKQPSSCTVMWFKYHKTQKRKQKTPNTNEFGPYLCVFKSVLQVTVPQAGNVAHALFGEPRYRGCEVIHESQPDQLRCCWKNGGSTVGRRGFFLQILISQLPEGRVRHALEEVAQGGVLLQLQEIRRTGLSVNAAYFGQ